MAKTRRGLNTLGKATNGKKKGVGTSDDTCMVVEPPVINKGAQKAKSRRSKAQFSTTMEDEPVFNPMPIRIIPPIHVVHDPTMEVTPAIRNNYLPWVDYTNVRELDNPKPSMANMEDDDVGGEKSHDEINVEENVIGEEVAPIVKERVIDSSCAEMSETSDVSKLSITPSVNASEGFYSLRGRYVRATDTITEGMDADIPSVTDTEAETAGNMERPYVGQGVDDTLDDDIHEVIPEEAGPKKKCKKRKHKKSVDAGESSVPKKKLSKEEKASKKARKVKRRARRDVQEATDAEAAEDDVPEEMRQSVPQPDVSDEWLPENEPQGDNADEEAQDSEEEDVAAVIEKWRKAKGKLRINENRTMIGNRRIPKNIAAVPTVNMSLNSEEEQARWRFVVDRRIAAEKMLSKVT
ncbi:hypothetical protein LIER_03761 [Lithospermum erythrorhizon]|uniref:Uncharacterized protein n=1 Tax=Lithospermum erythrorhizon TaxID=34254 RepID=A0AAV3NUG7_LITER